MVLPSEVMVAIRGAVVTGLLVAPPAPDPEAVPVAEPVPDAVREETAEVAEGEPASGRVEQVSE